MTPHHNFVFKTTQLLQETYINMPRRVRALSASLADNVHAVADAGQVAIERSATAVQRVLHRDEVPEWSKFIRDS